MADNLAAQVFKSAPAIVREAGKGRYALVAGGYVVFAAVALAFFLNESAAVKLVVFLTLFGGFSALIFIAMRYDKHEPPPVHMTPNPKSKPQAKP